MRTMISMVSTKTACFLSMKIPYKHIPTTLVSPKVYDFASSSRCSSSHISWEALDCWRFSNNTRSMSCKKESQVSSNLKSLSALNAFVKPALRSGFLQLCLYCFVSSCLMSQGIMSLTNSCQPITSGLASKASFQMIKFFETKTFGLLSRTLLFYWAYPCLATFWNISPENSTLCQSCLRSAGSSLFRQAFAHSSYFSGGMTGLFKTAKLFTFWLFSNYDVQ